MKQLIFFHFVDLIGIWLCFISSWALLEKPRAACCADAAACLLQGAVCHQETAPKRHQQQNPDSFQSCPFPASLHSPAAICSLFVWSRNCMDFAFLWEQCSLPALYPSQCISAFRPSLGQSPKVVGNHIIPMRERGGTGQRLSWDTEMRWREAPCGVKWAKHFGEVTAWTVPLIP